VHFCPDEGAAAEQDLCGKRIWPKSYPIFDDGLLRNGKRQCREDSLRPADGERYYTPPGYVYQVRPSTFFNSRSDELVDAIGLLKVNTIFFNITSIDSPYNVVGGSNNAERYGLVDPQGNFQINNPTSAMRFINYLSFSPPGGNDSTVVKILPFDMPGGKYSTYISNNVTHGFVYYYPTANVSHVDLDPTDVINRTEISDRRINYYRANGTIKNIIA
jgi:hypothetical protein